MGNQIQKELFEKVDFDTRLSNNLDQIQQDSNKILIETLSKINKQVQEKMNFSNSEMVLFEELANFSLVDAQSRFANNVSTRTTGIGAGVVGALIAKKAASKMAVKILAKVGAKTALKAGGIGGGAATGATIGALGGPVGSAIGGTIGGIIGWFVTDKIIIELDEVFNREEFEEELRKLVDQEKENIKNSTKLAYAKALEEISQENKENLNKTVEGLTLKELIYYDR